MKKVISTINITGFEINRRGSRRTKESIKTLFENGFVFGTTIRRENLVIIFHYTVLEPVHASLKELQNRP